MDVTKNARLRELLSKPGLVVAPGCHDGVGARIIQKLGFEVAYMGGNGTMGSLLGKPDIGLGTATEMVTRAGYLAECIDIPLVCDADTGYGNINNVFRTVRAYEAAGVSGIHIEDQTMPKKCGAMQGVTVVPIEEICDKIRIALKARKDPNFLIIARTDSFNTMGKDEVIRRCKMFEQAGADMVMPENLIEKEDMLKVTTAINNVPILADVCEFTTHQIYSDKELKDMGYKMVIHPLMSILCEAKILMRLYSHYKENGTTMELAKEGMFMPRPEYQDLVGYSDEMSIRRLID